MAWEIKKEPRMDWVQLVGVMLIYFGLLMLLIALHVLAINADGDTESILVTTFSVFLSIYVGAIIYGFVGILIKLFMWVTWSINTPEWKKAQIRKMRAQ